MAFKPVKGFKSRTEAQHTFAAIPSVSSQRSVFNRSSGLLTTFDSGRLIPIFVDEALPGDTFNMNATAFARISTLLHPIMDNVYLDFFFFSVPNRLLWDNWEKFNGAQDDPMDSVDFTIPQVVAPTSPVGYQEDSLQDHLGLPTKKIGITHSALFHRAYALIFNEWFRDENLQAKINFDTDDGPDTYSDYIIHTRGKRHDYFTSCLPWPQKGDAITLPLGTSAPVNLAIEPVVSSGDGLPIFDGASAGTSGLKGNASDDTKWSSSMTGDASWNATKLEVDLTGTTADLTSASAATINAIRQAFQLQKLAERDARGGTRYTEILRSHFGVVSPDQRLQRPEYLGGGMTPVILTPVPRTAGDSTLIGQLNAYGVAAESGIGFKKSFVEHSIVIGLVASRVDLNYQEGLDRMFSRLTRFDFYWPSLSMIGEQAVLNQELLALGTGGGSSDTDTFGYQERWAEYRYKPSKVTGRMRSNAAVPLDTWHLAQDFDGTVPTLNSEFIHENPPFSRIVGIPTEPDFLLNMFFDYKCARPMPTYSVPGMIDHF